MKERQRLIDKIKMSGVPQKKKKKELYGRNFKLYFNFKKKLKIISKVFLKNCGTFSDVI